MELLIKTSNGILRTIQISENANVEELQQKIEELFLISIKHQRLISKGKILYKKNSNLTIKHDVKPRDTILLFEKSDKSENKTQSLIENWKNITLPENYNPYECYRIQNSIPLYILRVCPVQID